MRFWAAIAVTLGMCFSASLSPGPAMAQNAAKAPPITLSQLEAKARKACGAAVSLSPTAITRADLDGDGRGDVLFDWRQVTCRSSSALMSLGAGHCGMHNCSIDIYLSSQYLHGAAGKRGWPKAVLNHSEIAPSVVDGKLRTATQGGSCKFAHVCRWEWSWNGKELVSRPLAEGEGGGSGAEGSASALPVTAENLTGIWAEAGDKCATDFVLALKPGGDYASYEENGDWRLVGNRIAVVVRETYTLGDAGSTRPVRNPKAQMMTVESLTRDRLIVKFSDGSGFAFRRCG